MPEQSENRIERIVDDLLHGRRLRLRAGDAEEKQAIIAAARLAAARSGPQRMSPAFRRRLAQILDSTPREPRLTRRAALVAGLGVAAGALAGGLVGRELAYSPAPLPLSASSPVVPRNGRWTDVGAMADFSEGQGKLVRAGAKPSRCGWITDPFGLSWQIIPRRFVELIRDRNPRKAKAVLDAMMTMSKLEVAALEKAYAGA